MSTYRLQQYSQNSVLAVLEVIAIILKYSDKFILLQRTWYCFIYIVLGVKARQGGADHGGEVYKASKWCIGVINWTDEDMAESEYLFHKFVKTKQKLQLYFLSINTTNSE